MLQAELGGIQDIGDANQNPTQTYTVTKVEHHSANAHERPHDNATVLGGGIVPPNNQGIATPFYNQGNDGEKPARDGVPPEAELDHYPPHPITNLPAHSPPSAPPRA